MISLLIHGFLSVNARLLIAFGTAFYAIIIFNIIGKKNDQTSVSDAGREIPSLGSTDIRKLCIPRFRHYPLTLGLGFLCLHQRPMIDYIYHTPVVGEILRQMHDHENHILSTRTTTPIDHKLSRHS